MQTTIQPRGCAVTPLVIVLLLVGTTAPALAFDCGKATSKAEKALCADPAAKASDDAMERAFAEAKQAVGPGQEKALLANQRIWLHQRNADCEADAAIATCLSGRDQTRSRILGGKPEAGPGASIRLVPTMVNRPGGKTTYEVDVLLYRSPDTSPAAKTLNAITDKMLAEVPTGHEADANSTYSYDRTASVAFASATLLSIPIEAYDFTGGAHGQGSTHVVNLDLRTGKELTAADLFDAKRKADARTFCIADLSKQKQERMADNGDGTPPAKPVPLSPDDKKQVADGVSQVMEDLSSWRFGADGATAVLDADTMGSHAEGSYECLIPNARLKEWAKPGFPLP